MSSHIYKTLLQRQIDNFVDTYGQDSNSLFKDNKGRLIHPGEYGMYREDCFKKLLQIILDKDYTVSDGFIINSIDQVSAQCDALVHRYNSKPLTDGSFAKFFPVEDIAAVCERLMAAGICCSTRYFHVTLTIIIMSAEAVVKMEKHMFLQQLLLYIMYYNNPETDS